MTDKEIENKAYELYPLLRRSTEQQMYNDGGWEGFVEGALWAQGQLIEKAWKWMMTHVCLHLGDKESFIKAMEE